MKYYVLILIVFGFTQIHLAQPCIDSVRIPFDDLYKNKDREGLQYKIDELKQCINRSPKPTNIEELKAELKRGEGFLEFLIVDSYSKNDFFAPQKKQNVYADAMSRKESATRFIPLNLFNNTFDAFVVDPSYTGKNKPRIEFLWKDAVNKNYYNLEAVKQKFDQSEYELIFATNGGMYNPDFQPQGLLIQERKVVRPLDNNQKGYGNFYLQPNGVFYLDDTGQPYVVSTQEFLKEKLAKKAFHATQSGPMLLIDGKHHPAFNKGSKNVRVRSGVGITARNEMVFIISKLPVNFYDFASVFLEQFGCQNALFLDGTVSRMYCPDLKRWDKDGNFGTIIAIVK